jgi:hypothetical protein
VCNDGKLISITIHPPPEHPEYAGFTHVQVEDPWQLQFAVYAGPWTEARSKWPRDSLGNLDDQDDRDRPFREYVRDAFDVANRDGDSEKFALLEEGIRPDNDKRFKPQVDAIAESTGYTRLQAAIHREQEWSRRLEEDCWSLIRTVARMLLDGCTDVAVITKAVRG